jgi:hypothetical protein
MKSEDASDEMKRVNKDEAQVLRTRAIPSVVELEPCRKVPCETNEESKSSKNEQVYQIKVFIKIKQSLSFQPHAVY